MMCPTCHREEVCDSSADCPHNLTHERRIEGLRNLRTSYGNVQSAVGFWKSLHGEDLIEVYAALLAVGERDKAEIEELRGELAVAYGGPDRDGKQREWFSALDRAKAEAEDLREAGERDRRQIARLTEALERIASEPPDRGLTPNFREFARAVLAGEEDAANG